MTVTEIKRVESQKDIMITVKLAKEIWYEHYTPIIGAKQVDYMLGKYQSEGAVSKAIGDGYTYCIAFLEGKPAGYFAIKEDDGTFLSKFYVCKNNRGMGIGRSMLEWIENECRIIKSKRIWLTCNKYNAETIQKYIHMGFIIIDSIVTDIGNGYVMDDYVMEKKIK